MIYRITEFRGEERLRGETRRRSDAAENALYRFIYEALDDQGLRDTPHAQKCLLRFDQVCGSRGGDIEVGNRRIYFTASRLNA